MALNILNLNSETIHFGLDHLEIYWTFKNETELFDCLDFDNSNTWGFEDYNIVKTEVHKYEYKIIFLKDNHSVFAYYKWKPKTNIQWVWTRDYIVIYSSAFLLLTLDEILYFLEWYFELWKCRRFDICMDLKIDIESLLNNFKEPKTWVEFKKSWVRETKYFWESKTTLNKRQLIRVYNKLLDTKKKKKIDLYANYFDNKDVSRVELEVRQELAKNVNYRELFYSYELLLWIFKNYLKKYTDIFEDIAIDNITLYRKPESIPPEKYQSLYYRTLRKSIFVWHARAIYNMWFCPIRVLIAEWFINDNTKEIIWIDAFDELLYREMQARANSRDEIYLNENWHDILDKLYKYGRV